MRMLQAVQDLACKLEGNRTSLQKYLTEFNQYAFLWQQNLSTEYSAFMATQPTLEVRQALDMVARGPNCCRRPRYAQWENLEAHTQITSQVITSLKFNDSDFGGHFLE